LREAFQARIEVTKTPQGSQINLSIWNFPIEKHSNFFKIEKGKPSGCLISNPVKLLIVNR
jgi:hypothetical protein